MTKIRGRIVPDPLYDSECSIKDPDGNSLGRPLAQIFDVGDPVVILPADEVCQCSAQAQVVPDNAIPAFGGYAGGMEEGEPFIKIDLNALTHACAVEEDMDFKWHFAEVVAHEVFHAVEDLVDEEFDHDLIHRKMREIREEAEDV